MRDALKGALAGLVLLALFGAIASRAGWLVASVPRPEGHGAWMLSRATGLVAYVALSLDVIAGLLVSSRAGDRWLPRAQLVDLHGWLSPLSLALVLAHAAVLVADGFVRFDAVDVLVPFAASHRPVAVGIGTLAAYLLLALHLSFGLRKRIGVVTWRRLHYVSFVVFLAVTVHALLVGTDRGRGWFAAVYATVLATVALLLAVRVRRVVTSRATGRS